MSISEVSSTLYPVFAIYSIFKLAPKAKELQLEVVINKLMAMQQRGWFGTLLSSLELFRFTPGKCQFWKAPENICRSLHLHKVVGKSRCRLWNSALLAPPAQGNHGFKMPWIWTQRSNEDRNMLPLLLPPCSSVLAYPVAPSHRARASVGWKQNYCAPDPELSILVFLWNQLDAECLQLKSRRDCSGFEWKWPMSVQHHASRMEMISLSITKQEGLWDSNLMW